MVDPCVDWLCALAAALPFVLACLGSPPWFRRAAARPEAHAEAASILSGQELDSCRFKRSLNFPKGCRRATNL